MKRRARPLAKAAPPQGPGKVFAAMVAGGVADPDSLTVRFTAMRFSQFLRFFGVGLASSLADYGSFVALKEAFGVPPVEGALIGYCLGGAVNYALNRAHTFETRRSHGQAGWRFAIVMAVGFGMTGLFMRFFILTLGWQYVAARLATTALVFGWNFIAHKLWTFAPPRPI